MGKRRRIVVMLVDTSVHGDARVTKTARTVQRMGYVVHIVGRDVDTWVEPTNPDLDVTLVKIPQAPQATGLLPTVHGLFGYRRPRSERRAAKRLEEKSRDAQTKAALAQGTGQKLRCRLRGSAIAIRWSVYRFRRRQRAEAVQSTLKRTRRWLSVAPNRDPREVAADDRVWRALQPRLKQFDATMAARVEELKPDIIHAHDYHAIGVAVRAAARARRDNRSVSVVYDAHEFVPGLEGSDSVVLGRAAYEAAHIRLADEVVTVSRPLAQLLVDTHGLDKVPSVTLNAPDETALAGDSGFTADVRSDCGLDDDVPLLVYSGGITQRRGLETAIAGLARLSGVHLAVVASADPKGRSRLRRAANEHRVSERLHILDYVRRECIIQHLRTADVAIHPLIHLANHEIAMPNKFFDYMHAGLPMVVSDVKYLSEVILDRKLGTVFAAEDPASFAQSTAELLADLPVYRANVTNCPNLPDWTWEAQEPVLAEIYGSLP